VTQQRMVQRGEAAKILGVSTDTLDRWWRRGVCPAPVGRFDDRKGRPRMLFWAAEQLTTWAESGMGPAARRSRRREKERC